MAARETYQPAFDEPAGKVLLGTSTVNLTLPTPYISYGLPYNEACASHVSSTFHASRVYIIASNSLAISTDRVDRLVSSIGEDRVVKVRIGVKAHTMWSDILSIVAECRDTSADCVVTIGAGSITDCAKVVVMALANNIQQMEDLARVSLQSRHKPDDLLVAKVPLITIPTSLSGAEYFSLAGATDDTNHHKHAFIYSGMGAKLVILDAELCTLTPPYYWLSTGVRGLDHCVEALCSLSATKRSDENAEKSLRLLVPGLLGCKADEGDLNARHRSMMGVIPAMANIRAGIPMGGSHAIGHQIGPLGVPHGITSCILCPAVVKYNLKYGKDPEIARKQQQTVNILRSIPEAATILQAAGRCDATDLGDILDSLIRALGLPRSLKEVGVGRDDIRDLPASALGDWWAPTNPVPLIEKSQVKEILESVLN